MILKILLAILLLSPSTVHAYDWTQDANCQTALLMDLDENPLTDDSQNTNTAALEAAGEPNFVASAKVDGGYIFAEDYLLVSDHASLDPGNAFTFICWFKPTDTISVTGREYFLQRAKNTPSVNVYSFYYNSSQQLVIEYRNSANANWRSTVGDITTWTGGTWYNIATFLNGTTLEIFADGVQDDSSNQTDDVLANAGGLYIGWDAANTVGQGLPGTSDEWAYFDTGLDSTDINDIMDNGLVQAVGVTRRIWMIS